MSIAGDFLYATLGDSYKGFLVTGRIGEGDKRPINITEYWEWPAQAEDVVAYVEANAGEDVYFSPMLYSKKKRKKEYVTATPVLWADTDEADPRDFEIEPSIIVETSDGRWQAYWCLSETVDPAWAEEMSKRITYAHLLEGSDYGWALTKYLRIPGTTNTKPGRDNFVVDVDYIGQVYSMEDIENVYGTPGDEDDEPYYNEDVIPAELPDRTTVLAMIPSNPALERALNTQNKIKGWSEELFWLECELFRLDLTPEQVFVAVRGSANDKYARDGRPDLDLWKDVLRAQRAATQGRVLVRHSGPEEAEIVLEAAPELLSSAEREGLPTTFIDEYVAWARTRTNGDVGYQEFAAMCILSTVLGDFGHAVPSFGKMRLNLWFMLLGVSSRTYKTTVKKLMLDILRKIQNDSYMYDLGSDTTPEGLLLELAEHPERSVLLHRDEANTIIRDSKGGKSYMSGFGETLTELYDGHVRGRLRATGKQRKVDSVNISFNLFLLGVHTKLADVLSTEDFASGFLARFLYVVGVPEPFEESVQSMRQMSEDEVKHDDARRTELCNRILSMRSFWDRVTVAGTTTAVRCSDEAWERFNKVSGDLGRLAYESSRSEVLEPSANRMNKMILKLATLLAMSEKKRQVELPHMLIAIKYAEGWYQHLLTVVGMVGRTEFGAQIDELTSVIGSTAKTYTQVRRQFKNYTQRQWEELIRSAMDLSLIDVEKRGHVKYIVPA